MSDHKDPYGRAQKEEVRQQKLAMHSAQPIQKNNSDYKRLEDKVNRMYNTMKMIGEGHDYTIPELKAVKEENNKLKQCVAVLESREEKNKLHRNLLRNTKTLVEELEKEKEELKQRVAVLESSKSSSPAKAAKSPKKKRQPNKC